jgi:threonine aldolase
MAEAIVGDDVFGDDPTVIRLQELAAERMGKEAGLFLPSGTMANLVAILAHCNRGDEAIMGAQSHTFLNEAGGVAALGGIQPFPLPNRVDGTLDPDAIRMAIRVDDPHYPRSRLVVLENTQNVCGGVPISVDYTQAVGELARENDLILHLDGARIYNAAAALGVDVRDLAAPADSVMFCLSKALCAPAGSMLCGTKEFIHKAVRIRKQVGGGLHQAGILAAAGIVALEQMAGRLGDDHARAKWLAEGLRGQPGLVVKPEIPATNMVYATLAEDYPGSLGELVVRFEERGIKIDAAGPRKIRLVTHYWIDDSGVERTIQAAKALLN